MKKIVTSVPVIILTGLQVVGMIIAGIGGFVTIVAQLCVDALKAWESK